MPDDLSRRQRFDELMQHHGGILHRVERLYAADVEDGRDLVQEIAMQVWRSLPTFRGDARASTWFYRVALNTALLHSRRRAVRERHHASDEHALEQAGTSADQPNEDVDVLYSCIRELRELDRSIVMLHLEGLSYAEIADTTGLTRSNVSVRLVRARKRLHTCLAAAGVTGV